MTSQREHHDDERRYDALVYRYIAAFDRGDLDALEAIVRLAMDDPELDRILAGVDAALHAEAGLQPPTEQARLVRQLLLKHVPSGVPEPEDEALPPPPTVGDVAVRLRNEHLAGQHLTAADQMANRQLLGSDVALPAPITGSAIARIVEAAGVTVSQRYQDRFKRAAIFLSMAREQDEIALAARRQGGQPSQGGRRRKRETRREEE